MKTIVGIDISKQTLDAHCSLNGAHIQVQNNQKGFKNLLKWLKGMKLTIENIHVVFEYTGMYSCLLETWLTSHSFAYSMVPGLQIKKSLGITRGKSDKVDAGRIAEYAIKNPEKLNSPIPVSDRKAIKRLQTLSNYRDRLVTQRGGFLAAVEDYKMYMELNERDVLIDSHRKMIKYLTEQIEKIEAAINEVIQSEKSLDNNYKLLQTVIGVGKQTALQVIVLTGNFSRFDRARKFATYCGIAPFPYNSGTSVKGKTKVSNIANKKMKSLLFMGASSAIVHDPELKAYFKKRIEKGKNKMSTLNIVKNKIVGRMFAVIKKQQPFNRLYQHAA